MSALLGREDKLNLDEAFFFRASSARSSSILPKRRSSTIFRSSELISSKLATSFDHEPTRNHLCRILQWLQCRQVNKSSLNASAPGRTGRQLKAIVPEST
jgi:hypothetical protein